MPGENRIIEGLTRKNSLFLSAAAQNNHESLSPVYGWFSWSVSFKIGHDERSSFIAMLDAAQFCQEETDRATIARLLTQADLGIAGLNIEETPETEMYKKFAKRLEPGGSSHWPEVWKVVRLLHRVGNRMIPFKTEQESSGTLTYLALLGPVVDLLTNGGALWVDELDTSLHPLMATQIIRLFSTRLVIRDRLS